MRPSSLFVSVSLLPILTVHAFAQQAQDGASPVAAAPTAVEVGEIVVTAQKREQRLKDVPLSVSALSPQALKENHITDFNALASLTPGFVSAPGYGFIEFSSIRGISSTEFGFGGDPSIAIYADGVYQGSDGEQVNALYDVERTEVIKGPQATLYGRSSIAGAINTIVNKPTSKLGFEASIDYGSRSYVDLEGSINVPLTETLFFRIAGTHQQQDGFLRNLAGGRDLGRSDITAGRAQLRYTGIDKLDALVRVDIEDRRQDPNIYQSFGLPNFTVNLTRDPVQPLQLNGFDLNKTSRGLNFQNYYIFSVGLVLNYQLTDQITLTSNSNYRHVRNAYGEDYDALPQVTGGPFGSGTNAQLYQQEVRASYKGDNGLSLIIGAAYSETDRRAYFLQYSDRTLDNLPDADSPYDPLAAPLDFSNAAFEVGNYNVKFQDTSVFADTTVPVTSALKLTGGVRFTSNTKRFTIFVHDPATLDFNAGQQAFSFYSFFTSAPLTDERTFERVTFRAAVNYDIDARNTAYFSFNQGYKAGGFRSLQLDTARNSGIAYANFDDAVAGGAVPSVVNPETSNSYEIGIKGSLFSRRLRYALSGFYFQYNNLQSIFQPVGSTQTQVKNIDAEGAGFELELTAAPTNHLTLFVNAGYANTRDTRDPDPTQVGLPLNFSPRWNGAAGGTFSYPAPYFEDAVFSLGTTATLRSAYRTDDSLIFGVGGYVLVDFRAGLSFHDDRFKITTYITNAFDRATFSRYQEPSNPLAPLGANSVLGEPRTFGIQLSVKY